MLINSNFGIGSSRKLVIRSTTGATKSILQLSLEVIHIFITLIFLSPINSQFFVLRFTLNFASRKIVQFSLRSP